MNNLAMATTLLQSSLVVSFFTCVWLRIKTKKSGQKTSGLYTGERKKLFQ